jgi:hypothetical protein
MGDFLFLLPLTSGSRSTATALPFPLSQDLEVVLLDEPAMLLATVGEEGRMGAGGGTGGEGRLTVSGRIGNNREITGIVT